ncbi:hypothetical protein MNBD_IGNAVI01-48 [hydrothermal vent metagenome]|uniref:Fibronectin type-III domain-containing protein n=1 Tax=hydrothermal vent metagenome TaxID=652676 RepID=A0A3B1CM73_9ZZZZ
MKHLTYLIVILLYSIVFSQPVPVGHWSFDNPNDLTNADIGNSLTLTGSHSAVAGPEDGDGAVRIGIGSYYLLDHGLPASGGGSNVNEFSLVFDIKIPVISPWYCFYQTDLSNVSDGEFFINPSGNIGVGDTYYTQDALAINEWYRIGISVKNGDRYDIYIDGYKSLKGKPGQIDGRFSFDLNGVLLFADNNSEDHELDVADVKLFSTALTDQEMKDLGGYHDRPPVVIAPPDTVILPYLQSPTESSIYVCWHASISPKSIVEYGTSESLGSSATGDVYIWEDFTTWHWVKLTNLQPGTVYYYRAISDTMKSDIYKFKTPPSIGQKTGHIRFAIIGDTRTYPNQFTNVVSSIREKVTEIYGDPDIENNLNLILSNGDIVTYGPTLSQYKAEWFEPLSGVTANVPMMVSIGDHEHDADNYYNYMKYEDFAGPQGERYYSFQYGRVLFIAVHSIFHTDVQLQWLDNLLQTAEADSTIDWVIAYTHRPGHSEIWPDGNESYVQDHVIPIMSKYSKADILTYGHSHAYERGQVTDVSLRLLENGGGGAELDRWREYPNQTDYPEIQKTYDYWSYTIIDIDVENKRYDGAMYAIGLDEIEFDNIKVDQFFRDKKTETPPTKPGVIEPAHGSEVSQPIILHASEYQGVYEILSSQFQVTSQQGNYTNSRVDNKRDFENIYSDTGAPHFIPIDKNAVIDLTKCSLENESLVDGNTYWWRVRYRDRNLQWSSWSEEYAFTFTTKTDVDNDPGVIKESNLYNNYPNPFNPSTVIKFDVAKTGKVTLRVYTVEGKLVKELMNNEVKSGSYSVTWNGTDSFGTKMSSGIYFYKLQTSDYQKIGKAILVK